MVGEGDNALAVVAACWNIVARLTVQGAVMPGGTRRNAPLIVVVREA